MGMPAELGPGVCLGKAKLLLVLRKISKYLQDNTWDSILYMCVIFLGLVNCTYSCSQPLTTGLPQRKLYGFDKGKAYGGRPYRELAGTCEPLKTPVRLSYKEGRKALRHFLEMVGKKGLSKEGLRANLKCAEAIWGPRVYMCPQTRPLCGSHNFQGSPHSSFSNKVLPDPFKLSPGII